MQKKPFIIGLTLGSSVLLLLGAAGLKISEYPNTATLDPADLFIVASGAGNKNIRWDQLLNLVPVSTSNVDLSTIDGVRPTNGIVRVIGTNSAGTLGIDLLSVGGVSATIGDNNENVTNVVDVNVVSGSITITNATINADGENTTNELRNLVALQNSISNSFLNVIALQNASSNILFALTNQTAAIKVNITNATEYDCNVTNVVGGPAYGSVTNEIRNGNANLISISNTVLSANALLNANSNSLLNIIALQNSISNKLNGTVTVAPTVGTNTVGGFTAVTTNSVTIATNQHTAGLVITSGQSTNFFRTAGGSAWLQSIVWTQMGTTTSDNKVFWFFSRPITAITNNAAWGPTEADLMYLCSRPIKLGCSTNELIALGSVGFSQGVGTLACPMVNTWTNRDLYYVVTQDAVVSANATSNAVTVARVRLASSND